ncbi:uncharacterized protein LOC110025411 [Phalaenopsis equestris]|uniref:uncharacterized protein LOC110025411 n=1 Tax=Phalaenopsis equestris TaxID=78828 RepID=UPI0009E2EDEA|nr:uncharacterized protein LOC110025411 [Phalaenopsis equestris]
MPQEMEGLQSPLKRKPDPVPAEEGDDEKMLKQQKLDAPLEESADAIQDDEMGQSVQFPADKGKEKMLVDKGKNIDDEGVQEPGDSSAEEEGSGEAEDEEIDLTDELLTEMDPDNIIPERTRLNGELVPGTYRMKGDDGDKEVEVGDEDYNEDLEEFEEQEETN